MAAYPFHEQSFYNVIVDSSSSSSSSFVFPNTNITLPQSINRSISMSGILEEPNNNNNNNNNNNSTGAYLFSSNSGNNSGISVLLQNHPPLPNMDHKRKYCNSSNHTSSSFNSDIPLSKDTPEVLVSKGKKQRKNMVSNNDDGPMLKGSDDIEERKKKKIGRRASCNNKKNENEKVQQEEQVATGYIHVRARRGQATDSHSLAERVRREKINERMKILQALVPGCDKVTGKALMLDEIINYVQSLQNQVEFLSMTIGSVNPMFYDFGMDLDTFMIKPEGSSLEEARQTDVQKRCSPKQSTTNTFNTTSPNDYFFPLLDPSAILLFQQAQMSDILTQSQPQNNGQLLWDNAEQGQKLFTPYSSYTINLPPFR